MNRILISLLAVVSSALAQVPAQAQSAQPAPAAASPAVAKPTPVTGTVKAANTPLPGVAVTAANTLTGKKVFTSTDTNGAFRLTIPSKGRWVVRAELAAFAAGTKEILLTAEQLGTPQRADFDLVLLSRQQKQSDDPSAALQQQVASLAGRGFQNMGLNQAEGGGDASGGSASGSDSIASSMPGAAQGGDFATESVSVSGAMGRTESFSFDEGELRQRIEDARRNGEFGGGAPGQIQIGGGGFGGGGGGPQIMIMGGGGGGRRGFRGFDINKPHGAVFYNFGDSALDARPYSLRGIPAAKPSYAQSRYGFFLGGPLAIPGLLKPSTKTMYFLNYFGQTASNPFDVFATVPTLAERGGDFSQTTIRSGINAGQTVTIIDPTTGLPFANNQIPAGRIDNASKGLLAFIPLPNQTGTTQNFHRITSADTNAHNVNFRLIHNFSDTGGTQNRSTGGRRGGGGMPFNFRHNINIGFNYRTSNADLQNISPLLGGSTASEGFNLNVNYVRGIRQFITRTGFVLNRNHTDTDGKYANRSNIAGGLGITGISSNPFDWGVPTLGFTDYTGLRDVTPALRDDTVFIFNENVSWTYKKHRVRFGGDFRRNLLDLRSNANPRGSFTFTGFATAATAGGSPVPGTGYDFADFLLGLSQQTGIQFSANTYHFNSNSYSLYIVDDWRATGKLTLNLGLRYEYTSPYSEASHRMVNLDANGNFSAVTPVQPGQSGLFTGGFPLTLVEPDRNNFAPRVGVAWSPWKKTVIRAGYGINYNLGQYGAIATNLAYQPPFSFTQTNIAIAPGALTLENGFPLAVNQLTNSYGVDRNFRVGYAQTWNLNIQRELPWQILMNVDYTGTKGTRLDLQRAPNRGPSGLRIPGVQPFLWDASDADSILHAGTFRLRKRLQHGIAVGGSYTYSKSLDNASTIGGGSVVVAQNDLNLGAERGLSSFDQRHRFTADYTYELPWGLNKPWLNKEGWAERTFGDWMLTGLVTLASGTPWTARVLGDFTDVARGVNGTLRADYNGLPVHISDPTVAQWFNVLAFTQPAAGAFGNSQRNMIIGPGTIDFDMALSKSIPVHETKTFNIRASASNLFNHANFTSIDTVVNSPTFGQVVSVGSMRKVQISTRFQF